MATKLPVRALPSLAALRGLNKLSLADAWRHLSPIPYGNLAFSKLVGLRIPYSGSIGATVLELSDGHARVELKDKRGVRNHLDCIHAIALINLGELTTGLAVFHRLDGRAKGIVTGLRIEYLKKARGTITASCDVEVPEAPGKHDLEVEGVLRDSGGETVAKVWATWQIKQGA